jgi:phosphoglycerate dehydrogenase-like enzyme
MKVVVLLRRSQLAVEKLAERQPGHKFVFVGDVAGLARELPGAEVLITSNSCYDQVVADTIRTSALKWIQFTMSGVDTALRFGSLTPGAVVTNAAGMSAPMVSEHAFALMLMLGHRLREAEAAAARQEWGRGLKSEMTALYGRTICIIGLGAIGREAAKRARAFGMTVIGVSRTDAPAENVSVIYSRERLLEAVAQADVVLVATNASAETRNLVGDAVLAAMKPTAILVNIARGELVDETALIAACQAGRLAGAALDVTAIEPLPQDSPLWRLPNVVITPHIAGGGADKSRVLLDLIDENISRYANGRPLLNTVDWQSMKLV